jgi:hypothetical protein
MVAVDLTGTREGNNTRTDSRAAPATLRLHLDVSILRQAQDRYVAKNAFASAIEATDNVAWPLLKNRVLTSSMNIWPPLAGCLLTGRRKAADTDLHHRQGRRRSLRPSWERPLLHLPRVLRRPRCLTGSPTRVTSSRNALTARTKRYGLTSRSTGLKTQLSAACLLLRGQLTCLPSCPRWATRDGKLPAQTLRSIVPPSQIGFQSKWRQKRGAFGISRPHAAALDRG